MEITTQAISGRYFLHDVLGEGGMGIVYRATDRLTGQVVAMKQVTIASNQLQVGSFTHTSDSQNFRLVLANEFQVLASLRHPNIISVLDYGFAEGGQPYFTMEYLAQADNLREAANGKTVREKVQLLIQVVQALAYLHRRGIVHRDLKPGNILVVDGAVRVLDFGLSVAVDQAVGTAGTFTYLAPELLKEASARETADLYAVGVMAYELLTHHHPFASAKANELLMDILYTVPRPLYLPEFPLLPKVIEKLLQKEPTARYTTADECLQAFYQAIGQSAPQESQAIRESYLQAARFVGREKEMAQLTQALAAAKQHQGSLWLVGGESGVGKSRLTDELRTLALVQGFLVLRGQGTPGSGTSYQWWREPLRRLVLTTELSDLEAGILKPVVPDIETLLGRPIPPAPELEGQAGQQRLLNSIIRLFYQQTMPVLLLLEDLHWATESLDVLRQLPRVIAERPLLIVGDYRDDERPQLAQDVPGAQVMKLERLSATSIAELCTAILGPTGQSEAVLALLQRETEGNAFFVVEVVRALAEEAGRLTEIGAMVLPEQVFPQGVQTIIQRRLDRVPAAAHHLLQLAAVNGRHLDLPLLTRLNGQAHLDPWLMGCADAAVLEIREGRWQFAHDKLREGLLHSLPAAAHVSLHQLVAEALEQVYSKDPGYAAALMRHWQVAGDQARELRYARLAGEHAAANFANTEALHFLSQALALVPRDDLITRYELLSAREKVYDLLGQREAQQQDVAAMTNLASQFANPLPLQVETSLRLANYAEGVADYDTAVAAARTAVTLAQTTRQVESEAEGHLRWGRALWRQAHFAEARKQLEQALQLAHDHREPGEKLALGSIEAHSHRNLGIIAALQSDHESSKRHFIQSLHLFREVNDRRGEGGALNNLGIISKDLGDFAAAYTYYQASLQLCREIGDRWGESVALNNLGAFDMNQGQLETARVAYEQAVQLCQQIGNSYGETLSLSCLGLLHHHLGEQVRSEAYCRQSLLSALSSGARAESGFALTILGHALAGQQEWTEAAAAYQQALTIRRELGQPNLATEPLAGLARVALAQGQAAAAMTPVTEILAHLEQNSLAGTDEPYRVYLTCYQVLRANQDPRATTLLQTGYHLLREQADRMIDITRRYTLLYNVPAHRELVALAEGAGSNKQ
ncbi:MAG: protein kinase [Candidatus Promineifilaceae bacterium]